MSPIAQTLDGKETFETKEELFEYAFSQMFEQDWIIYCGGIGSNLQTFIVLHGEERRIHNFHISITTQGNISYYRHHKVDIKLEINGLPITRQNYDMLTTEEIPTIKFFALNGCTYTYIDNYLYETTPKSYELFPNPTELMDLKIQSNDVKIEIA